MPQKAISQSQVQILTNKTISENKESNDVGTFIDGDPCFESIATRNRNIRGEEESDLVFSHLRSFKLAMNMSDMVDPKSNKEINMKGYSNENYSFTEIGQFAESTTTVYEKDEDDKATIRCLGISLRPENVDSYPYYNKHPEDSGSFIKTRTIYNKRSKHVRMSNAKSYAESTDTDISTRTTIICDIDSIQNEAILTEPSHISSAEEIFNDSVQKPKMLTENVKLREKTTRRSRLTGTKREKILGVESTIPCRVSIIIFIVGFVMMLTVVVFKLY